jgi:hypothetical protein
MLAYADAKGIPVDKETRERSESPPKSPKAKAFMRNVAEGFNAKFGAAL